ncbi:S8 family peptidase [Chloroflexota bacterium]
MAENGTLKVDRLPIKLIMPKQGKERKNQGGGQPPEPFRPVDTAYRRRLYNEVTAIRGSVLPQVKHVGTAPVRVKLLIKAIAKSHRPEEIFSYQTCPIIGVGKPGELFVKATDQGLLRLARIIEGSQIQQIVKELSCIEAIEAITPSYRRKGVESNDILRRSPRVKDGFLTRVKLFDVGSEEDQVRQIKNFEATCQARRIRISKEGYSDTSFVYGAECQTVEDIDAMSRVVGVRSIMSMPIIRTAHPNIYNPGPLPKLLKREDVIGDVPVVVVVDTGISDKIPELNTWIVGRESQVATPYRNTDHGTFVAGLICWGNYLNPYIKGIDENPSAIFDLQILPNNDPAKGQIDSVTEQEFLVSLDEALKQHANEYKVWNLSLSTEDVCSLDDFSTFAEELDNLQEKYEVSLVISAGNFSMPPLLDYPRLGTQLEVGRITIPADSILGITVGSISHVDCVKKGPKVNEPSAFSRHGAGPNYIIKPDLVHYGGACFTDGLHVSGIRSVNGNGTAEKLGTSFSTPLVSRMLA